MHLDNYSFEHQFDGFAYSRISCRSFYHRSVGFCENEMLLDKFVECSQNHLESNMKETIFITSVPMRCMEVWVRRIVYGRSLNSPYSASKAVQISTCLGGMPCRVVLYGHPFFPKMLVYVQILLNQHPFVVEKYTQIGCT
jgi:hypothetical protein